MRETKHTLILQSIEQESSRWPDTGNKRIALTPCEHEEKSTSCEMKPWLLHRQTNRYKQVHKDRKIHPWLYRVSEPLTLAKCLITQVLTRVMVGLSNNPKIYYRAKIINLMIFYLAFPTLKLVLVPLRPIFKKQRWCMPGTGPAFGIFE